MDEILNYNFGELCKEYPSLKPFVVESKTFRDGLVSVKHHFKFSKLGQFELFKITLIDKFNIKLNYVEGKLIPTIPSRIMYLDIIKQVLDECGIERVKGLDVGCGTYGIYCLLANKLYDWEMVGIDIDKGSVEECSKIAADNHLDIKFFEKDGMLDLKEDFTFVCCNPPFYRSRKEIEDSLNDKSVLKREKVMGTDFELIYTDGEVGFTKKLINESNKNDLSCWYSSLIFKKSSINEITQCLKNCTNWLIKEFQLGYSKKWIIFWSWKFIRPKVFKDGLNRIVTVDDVKINLELVFKKLAENEYLKVDKNNGGLIVFSKYGNVWSRSFRRNKLLKKDEYRFLIDNESIYFQNGKDLRVFQSFKSLIYKLLIL